MFRHIIYIINPISGSRPSAFAKAMGNKKKDLRQLIEKRMEAEKIPFLIFPSVASGDYSFLKHIIKEKKTTDVVVAGGDGTISQVVSSLMNCSVNFGIIPCGSGNGLAFTAKIPVAPDKALDIIFTGKPAAIDGFYINHQFACMLCGLGFDAKVAHDFAQQSKRGLGTYIKQVVKNFFAATPYPFIIKVDGKKFTADAFFISIANSNQYGNNFTIAPEACLSDGLLDIVIATSQSKLSMLVQTFKQIRGKNKLETGTLEIKKHGIIYFQTDKLSISNLSQAPLHIDGDPAETADEVEIEVKKKCFRLIQPG